MTQRRALRVSNAGGRNIPKLFRLNGLRRSVNDQSGMMPTNRADGSILARKYRLCGHYFIRMADARILSRCLMRKINPFWVHKTLALRALREIFGDLMFICDRCFAMRADTWHVCR